MHFESLFSKIMQIECLNTYTAAQYITYIHILSHACIYVYTFLNACEYLFLKSTTTKMNELKSFQNNFFLNLRS